MAQNISPQQNRCAPLATLIEHLKLNAGLYLNHPDLGCRLRLKQQPS